ncbi:MAG TPA: T9SS type A sorting domain-containing protein, partial [Saprospiraceae bacterium]|nr:T9SS type A sorting domain-containing protein [Saprospiraceae bacterium]
DGTAGTVHVIFIDAWDAAGNRDFCETYVRVQDQSGICTGPALGSIAGTIRTETQQTVEGVEVALSGPMTANATTPTAGTYSFSNLEENHDYTITPVLDVNYLNGVSTFDLVLIQRHILTVQPLNSPYKMIAADANNSQTITTSDIIILRRLILSIIDDLPNNTSWRFVPTSYTFPVPTNPWFEQFPEVINENDLQGDVLGRDFVAVKIGDVNGTVVPNLASVEDRNVQGTFGFDLEERAVKAGEEVKVAFRGKDMERIMGYQLTLGFDRTALSLDNIEYGVAKEGNFGLRYVSEGMITMSWHEMNAGNRIKSDEVLFTLVFRATASGKLSDLLSVSSRLTRAEAYDRNSRTLDVSLNFGSRELTEEYALYQNQPNPFAGKTTIGFYLPNAGEATLTITDVRGRVLKVFKGEYGRGMHQIQLDGEDLPAGVLQYTLISGDFTATRKMVLTR